MSKALYSRIAEYRNWHFIFKHPSWFAATLCLSSKAFLSGTYYPSFNPFVFLYFKVVEQKLQTCLLWMQKIPEPIRDFCKSNKETALTASLFCYFFSYLDLYWCMSYRICSPSAALTKPFFLQKWVNLSISSSVFLSGTFLPYIHEQCKSFANSLIISRPTEPIPLFQYSVRSTPFSDKNSCFVIPIGLSDSCSLRCALYTGVWCGSQLRKPYMVKL